jgi:hypothetical protein
MAQLNNTKVCGGWQTRYLYTLVNLMFQAEKMGKPSIVAALGRLIADKWGRAESKAQPGWTLPGWTLPDGWDMGVSHGR